MTVKHRRFAVAASVVFLAVCRFAHGQAPSPEFGYIAFRVDDRRLIANILVRNVSLPQVREDLSPHPLARYGYKHFELPRSWLDLPTDIRSGDRWLVHTSPARVIEATVDRLVGGYVGCEEGIGALLRVAAHDLNAFTATREKYFIAAPAAFDNASTATMRSSATVSRPQLTPDERRSLELTLNQLMARELPRIQSEAASWAQERRQIDDAMERGLSQLKYDVQRFRLSPEGVPVDSVRAEWLVGRRQGFAASLWVRVGDDIEVLETNVRPASMLRMSLFRSGVGRPHLGLILNVTDRDRDGWGEVLLAQEGYESRAITLLEYSPSGLQPTGIQMSGGC